MKSALKYLAAAVVVAAWIVYVWRNWESFASLSLRMDPAYLLAAFTCYVGFYLVMGSGWALTLRAMGGNDNLFSALHIWLVSTPARYLPGTGWHIAGRTYLGTRIGISVKDILVSTYIEQALAVVSGLVVFVIAPLGGGIVLDQSHLYFLSLIPLGLVLTHPRVLQMLLNLAARFLRKNAIEVKLSFSQVLALLVWFSLGHILSGLSLFLVLASISSSPASPTPISPTPISPLPISPLPLQLLPTIIGTSAFGWVVGLVSILTPGGIGVREATIVLLSSTFVAVPLISAAAFTTRFVSALAEVFLVGASTLVSQRFQPQLKGDKKGFTQSV